MSTSDDSIFSRKKKTLEKKFNLIATPEKDSISAEELKNKMNTKGLIKLGMLLNL